MSELAHEGHTVILITHDKSVAAHARRTIEIRDGTIVSDTGPDVAHVRPRWHLPPQIRTSARRCRFRAFREAMRMALRALRMNVFRTLLTLLGIVIGVGSVVAMMAIGEGAKQAVVAADRFDGHEPARRAPAIATCAAIAAPSRPSFREDADAIAKLAEHFLGGSGEHRRRHGAAGR